jgi:hypothetical protein
MKKVHVSGSERGWERRFAIPVLCVGLLGAASCDHADADSVVTERSALVIPAVNIVGFEATGGWAVSSGSVALSTGAHTQGVAALSVTAPQSYTTLVSLPLASGLPQLATLTDTGATVQIDLSLPVSQPNPSYYGALQLYINVPSKGVNNQYLGQAELTGRQLGTFQTYQFAVTDFVRSKLAGQTYSDLTFTVALNAAPGARGTYVFDNLRTTSPAAQPVGTIPSVDLVATLTQPPVVSTPGSATFTAGTIQIPASFQVRAGSAGTGTAKFELGFGTTTAVSCTYSASSDRTAYNFTSCTTPNKAGDIVAASFAKLTIVSGDPSAPLTKVKAQLAYDVLGDQVGSKLVAPIPTFWGTDLDQINAITMAWTNAEMAMLPSSERDFQMPIPDYAYMHGDGAPVNMLDGIPPPPNDPPFDFKGSLQNGVGRDPSGLFDGYYRLNGSASFSLVNQVATSHFEVNASAGVRIFSKNVDVLAANAQVNHDNGGTDARGSINPVSIASFSAKVLGKKIIDEPGILTDPIFDPEVTFTQDLPPIRFWVFTLTAGLKESAGFKVDGKLSINGFQLVATPHASVGVHIAGQLDFVIGSGGVDVTVQLLGISLPITASTLLAVDTSPEVCGGKFQAGIDGSLQLSTGGGSVDLVGKLGICPFCIKGSVPILHWKGFEKNIPFPSPFPIQDTEALPRLPDALCRLPLIVTINQPTENTTIFAGVPLAEARAGATRTPSRGQFFGADVPCEDLTWTSSDPANTVFSPSAVGCLPQITFTTSGQKTLTVKAVDSFGQEGTATVTVNVAATPTGPVAVITSPTEGGLSLGEDYVLSGYIVGGTGNGFAQWTFDGGPEGDPVPFSAGGHVVLPTSSTSSGLSGPHVITLTATDGNGTVGPTATVHVQTAIIK